MSLLPSGFSLIILLFVEPVYVVNVPPIYKLPIESSTTSSIAELNADAPTLKDVSNVPSSYSLTILETVIPLYLVKLPAT